MHQNIVDSAISRRVNLRAVFSPIIVDKDNPSFRKLATYPGFYLRSSSLKTRIGIGIFDEREVLVSRSPGDPHDKRSTLWSRNKCLVEIIQDYFNYVWASAEPVTLEDA